MYYATKSNKYHNKKVIIDGIKFASKLEATRYTELKLLENKGIIKDLVLQPSYTLIPSFRKGFKTDVYILKKKLFEYLYKDLTIREVKARRY